MDENEKLTAIKQCALHNDPKYTFHIRTRLVQIGAKTDNELVNGGGAHEPLFKYFFCKGKHRTSDESQIVARMEAMPKSTDNIRQQNRKESAAFGIEMNRRMQGVTRDGENTGINIFLQPILSTLVPIPNDF